MIQIGIDGGGTTTRLFVHTNEEEPRYFEFPLSLKVHNGDFAASAETLRAIISDLPTNENSNSTIRPMGSIGPIAIAMGLSGLSQPTDQEAFKNAVHALPEFADSKIQIESDATLTLKTVLAEGEEGILLIAGTGSVIFYQTSGGSETNTHQQRIGGWGPLLSDEGSGYRIGLRALRYYINVLDGVFPRDAFSEAIEVRMGNSNNSHTQRSLVTRAQSDPAFVASFARDAFEAAPNLKSVQDLIHEELIDLITLLFPIFLPGVMSGNMPYPLYLAGHVAQQPMTVNAIETAFEGFPLSLHFVDERAPAWKALELARGMR